MFSPIHPLFLTSHIGIWCVDLGQEPRGVDKWPQEMVGLKSARFGHFSHSLDLSDWGDNGLLVEREILRVRVMVFCLHEAGAKRQMWVTFVVLCVYADVLLEIQGPSAH